MCALGTLDGLIEQKYDRLHPSAGGVGGGMHGGNIHNHMTSRTDSFDLSYMTQPAPPSSTSNLIRQSNPPLFNSTPLSTPFAPSYNSNNNSMNISQDIPTMPEGGHNSDPLPTSSTITSDYTIGSMKGDPNTNTAAINNSNNSNSNSSNSSKIIHIEGAIDVVEEGESPHTLPSSVAGMYILYTIFLRYACCVHIYLQYIYYATLHSSTHLYFVGGHSRAGPVDYTIPDRHRRTVHA